MIKTDNIIKDKSFQFAIRIVKLYQFLTDKKKEYILSKQLLRSGTSIGANIREGINAPTKKDFTYKLNISLKEASETEYWLELLMETNYLTKTEYNSIVKDCTEIIKILTAIIKRSRINV
jgi:four helix bundle protein